MWPRRINDWINLLILKPYAGYMGQGDEMTLTDLAKVNRLYRCEDHYLGDNLTQAIPYEVWKQNPGVPHPFHHNYGSISNDPSSTKTPDDLSVLLLPVLWIIILSWGLTWFGFSKWLWGNCGQNGRNRKSRRRIFYCMLMVGVGWLLWYVGNEFESE